MGAGHPPEVQEQIGEIPADVGVKAWVTFGFILLLMLVFPLLLNRSIIHMNEAHGNFLNLALQGFILPKLMNLYDLILVDILIFNIIQPDFMTIKSVEEYLKEYATATFHFIAFLKGQPYMIVMALLAAGISLFLKKRFSVSTKESVITSK